jgi:hypothetical protein
MAMFANTLELDTALRVLDRVVLHKSQALIKIMEHVLPLYKREILDINDSGLLQAFLLKEVFTRAVAEGKFFPPL